MAESPPRPRCRALEVQPIGEDGYLLQDPAGHQPSAIQVSPMALFLLGLCDGERDHAAIQAEFQQRTGMDLPLPQLADFIEQMDRNLLLDSPSFRDLVKRQRDEFLAEPWRPASHAGGAYEGDPAQLARVLDTHLDAATGAGLEDRPAPEAPLALLAPHIDLHRGGASYGKAYAALRDRPAPDVVVVLGTAHAGAGSRFVLCDKGYRTPRGDLPVDREFLGRLQAALGSDGTDDVLVHRHEHSIEFQALFLAHLFQDQKLPGIVPILCTTVEDCLAAGRSPLDEPEVAAFLGALRDAYQAEQRRILVVGGVDLSHVGPRFGDPDALDESFLAAVRDTDRQAIDGILSGRPQAFFDAVRSHGNSHRICSVAAIYSVLHTVQARRGVLLDYDQAVDPEGQLAVTFAGIALYGERGGAGRERDADPV